jgi:hypothetical protein
MQVPIGLTDTYDCRHSFCLITELLSDTVQFTDPCQGKNTVLLTVIYLSFLLIAIYLLKQYVFPLLAFSKGQGILHSTGKKLITLIKGCHLYRILASVLKNVQSLIQLNIFFNLLLDAYYYKYYAHQI